MQHSILDVDENARALTLVHMSKLQAKLLDGHNLFYIFENFIIPLTPRNLLVSKNNLTIYFHHTIGRIDRTTAYYFTYF